MISFKSTWILKESHSQISFRIFKAILIVQVKKLRNRIKNRLGEIYLVAFLAFKLRKKMVNKNVLSQMAMIKL